MDERFALEIPREIVEEMIAQAEAELPNECCGLLCGFSFSRDAESSERSAELCGVRAPLRKASASRLNEKRLNVTHRFPLVNALQSPVAFESDARSMFEAMKVIRRLDLELLAVYHSHPTSEPVPSRTDLRKNYSEGVQNVIIGQVEGKWAIRSWWLGETEYLEAKLAIVDY